MVYNAMKLFMEINPQLFDDCSHEYTEQQTNAPAREALRERKWAAIQDQASKRKPLNGAAEVDQSEDNQKRLDSLKLDGAHERQSSVGSSRSR
jgi:serine/threonine-protein phosphatase 2A regulatory subunit B'